MAKELIARALPLVRRRFMDISSQHFPQEMAEHELVVYRAKMVFDNTVIGGKSSRSELSMAAFEALRPDAESEVKNVVAQAAVTLEMIQAFYLIADDIMDQSETRRGKPTWFKTPGIGYSAINDAFLLDVGSVEILRQLYPAHSQLHRILDAYHRSKKTTVIGQLIDSATEGQFKSFTWDRYEQLVQHKTSHYTFFHPLEQALLISDILKGHEEVRRIAYKIGFLFQAQDDVLDVYGDPEITGKVGTDLKDAKCTFLTTRAVMKLSSQRLPALADFEEHFGKPERSSLTIIRQIMDDLRIKDEFVQLQNAMAKKIIDEDLQKLPAELEPLSPVLENLVVRLLNRTK